MTDHGYTQMWDEFAGAKGDRYLTYKFNPTHRVGLTNFLREEKIYQLVAPKSTDVILDVGCASGRQLFKLADKIHEGYGTDISQGFIDKANENKANLGVGNLFFEKALIESLPYPDAKFDSIICGEVLEHVHDKDVALNELIRVLKPSGHLIITVPNLNSDGTWWGRLMRTVGKRKFTSLEHFSTEELNAHGDAHVREFTKTTMRHWLESHDLEIESLSSVSFIDGPYGNAIIKFPLHVPILQKLIIAFEKLLNRLPIFLGRHLAVKARKK
jgi:ubiquinone/menaquinone biosynthesis C-methylase UbiE